MSDRRSHPTRFRRANERIAQLAADPLVADDVRTFAAERERVNRIHARGLADIRKTSNLTRQQMAQALGTLSGLGDAGRRSPTQADPRACYRKH